MYKGEGPIGGRKGKQTNTVALCKTPACRGGGGGALAFAPKPFFPQFFHWSQWTCSPKVQCGSSRMGGGGGVAAFAGSTAPELIAALESMNRQVLFHMT